MYHFVELPLLLKLQAEKMMSRLVENGIRYYPHYALASLTKSRALDRTELLFHNGMRATAGRVILNVPKVGEHPTDLVPYLL